MAQPKTVLAVTSVAKSAHSVRTHDETWNRADRRAKAEGTNISAVINEILDGYGKNLIDLPKTQKVYTQPRS